MGKILLISSEDKHIRAALLDGNELIEYFFQRENNTSLVGDVYKGRIEDVVPGLEAAFVDIGLERKAFLHFSDLMPEAIDIGKPRTYKKTEVRASQPAPYRPYTKRRPRKNTDSSPKTVPAQTTLFDSSSTVRESPAETTTDKPHTPESSVKTPAPPLPETKVTGESKPSVALSEMPVTQKESTSGSVAKSALSENQGVVTESPKQAQSSSVPPATSPAAVTTQPQRYDRYKSKRQNKPIHHGAPPHQRTHGHPSQPIKGGKKVRRGSPHKIAANDVRPSEHIHWAKKISPGQYVMVQVIKDGFGEKAPRLTTNVSLPGRLMVLLPFSSQSGGVSKRIISSDERLRLKRLLKRMGSRYNFIIRTAGASESDNEIVSDSRELARQWQNILRRYRSARSPKLLYDDQNIFTRLARDVLTSDIDQIIVDSPELEKQMRHALEFLFPEKVKVIKLEQDKAGLFEKYGVEKQVRRTMGRKIWLKNGGFIFIDETEALTTIDVNSGRFISKDYQEKTILQTNLEACEPIAQQMRIRDLSGIIIIDFIDMQEDSSRQKVEQELRRHLRKDRAKMAIGGFTDFGLFQLTRKRRRQSLLHQMTIACPYCDGSGRLSNEWEIWRNVKNAALQLISNPQPNSNVLGITLMVHPRMSEFIQREFADTLNDWKKKFSLGEILFISVPDYHLEEYNVQLIEKKRKSEPMVLSNRPRNK